MLRLLQDGLLSVGSSGLTGSVLGGNFELTNLVNLVTGSTVGSAEAISGMSLRELNDRIDRCGLCQNVRIQIETPLRLQRRDSAPARGADAE